MGDVDTKDVNKGKSETPIADHGPHMGPPQVPELLGTTENELGLRKWLEDQGHTLVTTSDKEGEGSTFDKELVDAEVIITTPYVVPSAPRVPEP